MNKKLGPGILFILGIALLYFGGVSGGTLGAGLSVGGLVCLIAGIIGGVKKLFGGGSIENRTKATARTMLSSFLGVQKKYNYSIETASDKVKIYTHILKLRGYTENVIKELLEQAQELSTIKGSTQGISINTLVFLLVIREYVQDTNKKPTKEQLAKVESIIAEMF